VQSAGGTELSRERIARETLERYTGSAAAAFQPQILLTNFQHYVDQFALRSGGARTDGSAMAAAHDEKEGISIIRFGIGSPNAALIMDLLSFIEPQAVVFLGLCGGLSVKHRVGDFFLPSAAIRDEGTSRHYLPERVPAMPYFHIQRRLSLALDSRKLSYRHGIIHTTNYRFWEFDQPFREGLVAEKAKTIDMECATLFSVAFARDVRVGALLLISDLPLASGGIKTKDSSQSIFDQYTSLHLEVGSEALSHIRDDAR
jgi:AMP nucleosidase